MVMKGIQFLIILILISLIGEGCNSPTDSSNQTPDIESMTATPDTITVGRLSTVVVKVTNTNGDPLSYSWSSFPGDLNPSAEKNTVFFTASSCCTGANPVTVVVKDGRGGESQGSVQIEVLP